MSRKPHGAEDSPVASFEELFQRWFDGVWRLVRRRVETSADADDLTGEVFAVAWRRRTEMPRADEGDRGSTFTFFDFGADITITAPE